MVNKSGRNLRIPAAGCLAALAIASGRGAFSSPVSGHQPQDQHNIEMCNIPYLTSEENEQNLNAYLYTTIELSTKKSDKLPHKYDKYLLTKQREGMEFMGYCLSLQDKQGIISQSDSIVDHDFERTEPDKPYSEQIETGIETGVNVSPVNVGADISKTLVEEMPTKTYKVREGDYRLGIAVANPKPKSMGRYKQASSDSYYKADLYAIYKDISH